VRKNALVVGVALGTLSDRNARPVLHDTLFPLLELTKALEAVAVMHVVRSGVLKIGK
jgi:hypothetical protein